MMNESEYHKQVAAVLQATVIHSPTTYSWFGKQSWPLSRRVKQALTVQASRRYLLFTLQHRLYNDFYTPGFARTPEGTLHALRGPGMDSLVEMLSEANAGDGYWEAGWRILHSEGASIVVHDRNRNMKLWVRPEECLASTNEQMLPGSHVSLHFPKEMFGISPGFYMARGNTALTNEDGRSLVRLYWNLSPEGAPHLMHDTTTLLNQAHCAFTLKILDNPQHFTRCDAAVLYIRKQDYAALADILATLYVGAEASLRPGTPAFTKRLAAGLGLAEDTAQAESFGEQRCRLLAEGMIRAFEQGKRSVDERLRVVEECFTEAGISLEKPFLAPGSRDTYDFQPTASSTISSRREERPRAASPRVAFLHTAEQIGRRIAAEAIWYEQQCNWLGASSPAYAPASAFHHSFASAKYQALGPELYNGTSGIALFLAELSKQTGDGELRQTAPGAIRQALAHVDALPPAHRLGLYTGWTGIALVAVRIGVLLGEEELLCQGRELLQRLQRERLQEYDFDLIYGAAGAIIALLTLRDMLDDASLLDFAVQLGNELVQTATRSEAGCSWRSLNFPSRHNLLGFSHGTSGAAYALLALFQATGTATYRSTAEAAFDYERHWFNADVGNWPDLRDDPVQSKRAKRKQQAYSFAAQWCHGAAGIALSRLRAYQLLRDERYKTEAICALQTTSTTIDASLYSGINNFSLCHGLAGDAEILLEGKQVLGGDWTGPDDLALAIANFGIDTYASGQQQWPCGIQGGTTPGMLTGLAGIGYFFLRLHQPSIPSILL